MSFKPLGIVLNTLLPDSFLKQVIFPQLAHLQRGVYLYHYEGDSLSDLLTVEETDGVQVLEYDLRHVPQLVEDGVAQYVFVLAAGPLLSPAFSEIKEIVFTKRHIIMYLSMKISTLNASDCWSR